MQYLFSPPLAAFLRLAVARMRRGQGAVLLLEGPPGAGKTAFAKAVATEIGGNLHYYAGAPDKERDLLYEVDVDGVLRREAGWVAGPAWQAFDESTAGKPAVLLIDEVDKTSPGFDAFLLRMLEEWTFRAPSGGDVHADPANLVVVLTSNGRRDLRPEVLRRCQRIHTPSPEGTRLRDIVTQIAGQRLPAGLLDVLLRLSAAVRRAAPEAAATPKEVAMCALDLLELGAQGIQLDDVWRQVAASWLVKGGGPEAIDRAVPQFRWARALRTEAIR